MVFLKKICMLILAMCCCAALSSCMKFTGIKPYDKKRDRVFITKESLAYSEDAAQYIDLDVPAGTAIMPVPPENKEQFVTRVTLMGIPESALVRNDKRWAESIVIRIDEQLIYVYLVDDKPVSFIRVFRFGDEFLIAYFKTADAYQGKGIGGKMVVHAVTECKKRGANKIMVATGVNNKPAQSVYTKNGFVPVREVEPTSEGGEKQVVLEYKGLSK